MKITLKMSKQRKLILSIGAVLLLIGLVYRLAPVVRGMGDQESETVLKRQKMARYISRVQEAPLLENRRNALDRNLDRLRRGLLQGTTPALAAVAMQNLLREIAEDIDVEIRTAQVLKTGHLDESEYITIPVQFSTVISARQLQQLLYKVESSATFLRVTDLKINADDSSLPVQLRTTMTIEGLMVGTDQV